MTVFNVQEAAKFLGVSEKTARSLIPRLPHGDASRSSGPNRKLLVARETLEKFVLGEIEPTPIGSEATPVDLPRPRKKHYRYTPPPNGPIPNRKPDARTKLQFVAPPQATTI